MLACLRKKKKAPRKRWPHYSYLPTCLCRHTMRVKMQRADQVPRAFRAVRFYPTQIPFRIFVEWKTSSELLVESCAVRIFVEWKTSSEPVGGCGVHVSARLGEAPTPDAFAPLAWPA